ncbi:type II secretion system F family protein, partial [Rhizobium ruizarguesonis]
LPLNDAIRLIATEGTDPVKSEFRRLIEAQQVGLSIPDACARMTIHMPLQEVNFFAIVIAIQSQSGGNLSTAPGPWPSSSCARAVTWRDCRSLTTDC